MDSAMPDDDVWRRAYLDSSGLFDSFSVGPLLSNVAPADAAPPPPLPPPPRGAALAPPRAAGADPTPPTFNNVTIAPSPTPMDFAATPFPQPATLLPCPSVDSATPSLPVADQSKRPAQVVGVAAGGSTGRNPHGPPRAARGSSSATNVPLQSASTSAAKAAILAAEAPEDLQVRVAGSMKIKMCYFPFAPCEFIHTAHLRPVAVLCVWSAVHGMAEFVDSLRVHERGRALSVIRSEAARQRSADSTALYTYVVFALTCVRALKTSNLCWTHEPGGGRLGSKREGAVVEIPKPDTGRDPCLVLASLSSIV